MLNHDQFEEDRNEIRELANKLELPIETVIAWVVYRELIEEIKDIKRILSHDK